MVPLYSVKASSSLLNIFYVMTSNSRAPSREQQQLLVIGAGLPRTGTNSLQLALQELFHAPCYHMHEVVAHPEKKVHWMKALEQGNLPRSEWNALFAGYCATVDFPGSAFYKQLHAIHPQAKVILSVRDADSWLKSLKSTIMKKQFLDDLGKFPLSWIMHFTRLKGFYTFWRTLYSKAIPGYEHYSAEQWKQFFHQWNAEVIESIPSEQLLVFRAEDGWEPLCKFLNAPVPTIPYPHVNSTEEMQVNISLLQKVKYGVNLLGAAAVTAAVAWIAYNCNWL